MCYTHDVDFNPQTQMLKPEHGEIKINKEEQEF